MNDFSKLFSVALVLGILALAGLGIPNIMQKQHDDPNPLDSVDMIGPIGIVETALVKNPRNITNKGSGVFITPTKFLTAAHVAENITRNTVTRIRMEDGNLYNVVDVRKDDNTDIGVVTVDRPYRGWTPSISCGTQKRGTELITIGNPLAMEFIEVKIMATGGRPTLQVSQNDELTKPKDEPKATPFEDKPGLKRGKKFTRIPPNMIGPAKKPGGLLKPPTQAQITGMEFFQGPALPGQSGSPVFDKNGKVVGVISVSVVEQNIGSFTGLGMYVPINGNVCDFIKVDTRHIIEAKK